MTKTTDELEPIISMTDDMEVIEKFLLDKGRFVGDMVHISIQDLAKAIRNTPSITVEELEGLFRYLLKVGYNYGWQRNLDGLSYEDDFGLIFDLKGLPRLQAVIERIK